MLETLRARVADLIAPPSSEPPPVVAEAVESPKASDDEALEQKGLSLSGFDFVSNGMGKIHYFKDPDGGMALSRETAYALAAYCYVATLYRAKNVSEPPLMVVRKTPDGEERVRHPLDELLEEPSIDYDMGETLWLTQASLDLYGRTLWVGDADRLGRLASLRPWMGDEVRVHSTADRIFGLYEIELKGGQWVDKQPEEVIDFRYLSPYSRHTAESPAEVAMSWLNLAETTRVQVRSMMKNGIFPSIVVQPHHEWRPDDDEWDRFKHQIEKFHAGPTNTGKPLTLLGGGNATRVSFSLKDLLPEEILDRIEAVVASVYGIAPVILGFLVGLKNSPWSQMEEARRFTYEDTIAPLWKDHQKVLTRQLLRRLDPLATDLHIRFDLSGVAALKEDRSQLIQDAQNATTWTLDERRVHAGQKPLGGERGEWVEVIDGRSAPALEVEIDDDAKRARAAETTYSIFAVMTKSEERRWEPAVQAALTETAKALAGATSGADFVAGYEDALSLRGKMVPAPPELAFDRDEVEEWEAKGSIEELVEILMAATKTEVIWEEVLEPLVSRTATVGAIDVAKTHGIDISIANTAAREFAERHAAELVTGIGKTNRERLGRLVETAIADGASVDDLAKAIEEATAFGETRARLIAETEVVRVSNGASRKTMSDFAAEQVGISIVEKAWLSARDERVREEHNKLDERGAEKGWIPVDQPFANGLQVPGEPRCRCTPIYRVRDA